jgi:drug/metabolite transporter (DMT)-like permease
MRQHQLRGAIYCLIATASWGAMFPVMTGALVRIDPFTFTLLRYLIAGAAFLAVLIFKEGWSAVHFKGERMLAAWALGTAGFAGFNFLIFLGQKMIGKEGALVASIIAATMPMLGLLVNWALSKAKPSICSFLFILLSFCGVALVVTKGYIAGLVESSPNFRADVLMILGASCWVIYTFGATFYPKWSPLKYTTLTTGLGVVSMLVVDTILLASKLIPVPRADAVVSIVPHLAYMTFCAGFVAVLSWNVGNKILTPLNGVLFFNVVPLTSFAISALEGLAPTTAQILGAGLTALALIGNNLTFRWGARRTGGGAQNGVVDGPTTRRSLTALKPFT